MRNITGLRVALTATASAAAAIAAGTSFAGAETGPQPTVAVNPVAANSAAKAAFPALEAAQGDLNPAASGLRKAMFPDGRADRSFGIEHIDLDHAVSVRFGESKAIGHIAAADGKVCLLLETPGNGLGATCLLAEEAAKGNAYILQNELAGGRAELLVAVPAGARTPVVRRGNGVVEKATSNGNLSTVVLAGDDQVVLPGGTVVGGIADSIKQDLRK